MKLCATCQTPIDQLGYRRKYCDEHAPKPRKRPAKKAATKTPISTPSTVALAATQGRRQLLEALRTTIAQQIDMGVPARDLGTLSKRLVDISDELEGLIAQEEGDDIAQATNTPDESWTPAGGSQARTA